MSSMPPAAIPPDRQASHQTRMATRQQVLIGVKLRRQGESWFQSRIIDISRDGFRLSTFVVLKPGMMLWVMLPGFEGRPARVSWVGHREAGCRFEQPLHDAIVDHIIRMSGPGRATDGSRSFSGLS